MHPDATFTNINLFALVVSGLSDALPCLALPCLALLRFFLGLDVVA